MSVLFGTALGHDPTNPLINTGSAQYNTSNGYSVYSIANNPQLNEMIDMSVVCAYQITPTLAIQRIIGRGNGVGDTGDGNFNIQYDDRGGQKKMSVTAPTFTNLAITTTTTEKHALAIK